MRHLLMLLLLLTCLPLMADELSITDGKGTDISVEVLPAPGDLLMIWLVDHTEKREMFDQLLQALNRRGVEIWRVDLLGSYFLPRSRETIRTLPGVTTAVTPSRVSSLEKLLSLSFKILFLRA